MPKNYVAEPNRLWRFLSDRVMGVVSVGQAEREGALVRLSGRVSTKNGGGFVQVRTELSPPLESDVVGLKLVVRGNGERYFVHLRTRETVLPWHYYQAGFETTPRWTEVRLPLAGFSHSAQDQRVHPRAASVTSFGLAAFGRDHDAMLEVRELASFYRTLA